MTLFQHPSSEKYQFRREMVFFILSGLFVGTLAMLNILGISRLIDLSFNIGTLHIPFKVFVGILPYPLTFLCTDFISEFYGRRRANMVVWVGLLVNIWVLIILWVGGLLPPVPTLDPATSLPSATDPNYVFFAVRQLTFGATLASMVAYLTAQFVDVEVFHWLKRLSRGRMLWLRNNVSTLTSQMVDSVSVVLITYFVARVIIVPEGYTVSHYLGMLIVSNYLFKMVAALADTIPFYLGTAFLKRYLQLDPVAEYSNSTLAKIPD